ncbi:hypothetical protein BDV41DRAFT_578617 [Aspergillus transmontanensis]|uniref:Uncharacterized protein n=1 Tax=Aspergillus transmontanensis TaxID=1034304 RepID=A0A5N6VSD9_9EURO|nr:hypothetical protein BDV41DRAFT_578617 [Aspergillus transmontanensis]
MSKALKAALTNTREATKTLKECESHLEALDGLQTAEDKHAVLDPIVHDIDFVIAPRFEHLSYVYRQLKPENVNKWTKEEFGKVQEAHLEFFKAARDYIVILRDKGPSKDSYKSITEGKLLRIRHVMNEDLAWNIDRRFLPPQMTVYSEEKKAKSQIIADWDKDDNDEDNEDDNGDDNGYKWDDDDDDNGERGLKYYVGGNTGDMWIKLAEVLVSALWPWNGGRGLLLAY